KRAPWQRARRAGGLVASCHLAAECVDCVAMRGTVKKTKTPPGQDAQAGKGEYSAADIEVLEGLEPVRKRPGMYIGGTAERAMHRRVSEIPDGAMDEAVAG